LTKKDEEIMEIFEAFDLTKTACSSGRETADRTAIDTARGPDVRSRPIRAS
jgi:hypothetical protein